MAVAPVATMGIRRERNLVQHVRVLSLLLVSLSCSHALIPQRHQRHLQQDRLSKRVSSSCSATTARRNYNGDTTNDIPQTVESYILHWDSLLQQEHQAAVDDLREQRTRWSTQRLQAAGVSLLGVAAEPDSELFGEKIVRISTCHLATTTADANSWRDLYNRGDVLLLTPEDSDGFDGYSRRSRRGSPTVVPREICVVDVGTDWMTAGVGPSWPAGLWESRKQAGFYLVRLDRTIPQATLLAQKKALDRVRKGKAGTAAEWMVQTWWLQQAAAAAAAHDNINTTRAEEMASQVPTWLQKAFNATTSNTESAPSLVETAIDNSIEKAQQSETGSFVPNNSQRDAIAWALKRRISLLIGPPGTGKTICAARLIASAIQIKSNSSCNTAAASPRVLAVAHSNGAADVLLQALLDRGVPAVRVGRPASVAASVRHRTVVAMAEQHPAVRELRRKIMDLSLERHVRNTAVHEMGHCVNDVRRMIAATASVVVASCIGAHQLLATETTDNGSSPFDMVVLDEAAQTTEPALLCALAAAQAEQIVLVGDPRQLPPTIAGNSVELRNTLGVSPMARLEQCGVGQQTLRVQYRMSPDLLQFPSKYFYKGLVTCAENVQELSPPASFPWPNGAPMAFVQVGPNLETTHDRGGKSNPTEAALVVDIVSNLQSADANVGVQIAVISPYAKQVQLIRTMLLTTRRQGCDAVRVGTVDSFQGQETDVVVFSACRSNLIQDLGFLRDPRRLCVALTRAKRGLIVLGDPLVLQTSRPWEALLQSCRDRGCLLTPKDLFLDSAGASDGKVYELEEASPSSDTSDAALLAALEESLNDHSDSLLGLLDTVLDTTKKQG
ncbi:polymerase alpha-associated DNA helicase A [Seminavis robusta]|uniref:Polymerase alpha-associated DNA helicase A n=1 Tax=Seminavis robusta TaxID=568900 RepID=A0A9N8HKZ1_9STRA|nr:polymerase alpha-associated DNA helicase A [Seminavis robusta]|eukprot:Sro647_g180910.1 polymerase alpha-associated DNA helicase A (840) ;mRNA; f:27317-29836